MYTVRVSHDTLLGLLGGKDELDSGKLTKPGRAVSAEWRSGDAKSLELLSNLVGETNAKELFQHYGSLTAIGREDSVDLGAVVAGLTDRQIVTLSSAFALAACLANERLNQTAAISGPSDVANIVREEFRLLSKERLLLLAVDVQNRLIRRVMISDGQQNSLVFDQRDIFRIALQLKAAGIFLAHNHPSGNLIPSRADIDATKLIHRAGQLLNIPLIDHVIVGSASAENETDFVSLKELGHVLALD